MESKDMEFSWIQYIVYNYRKEKIKQVEIKMTKRSDWNKTLAVSKRVQ
jgi:hypothetical protein